MLMEAIDGKYFYLVYSDSQKYSATFFRGFRSFEDVRAKTASTNPYFFNAEMLFCA